jgi:hypothetical protein
MCSYMRSYVDHCYCGRCIVTSYSGNSYFGKKECYNMHLSIFDELVCACVHVRRCLVTSNGLFIAGEPGLSYLPNASALHCL